MNPKYYDYLIIGQGLAGSLLAWRLINAGQRVLVVDNDNPSAASRVAAGLLNPVTGKRLVKEANAEAYLVAARDCYAALSAQFGEPFLYDKPMLRLFDNDEFKQVWQKRRGDVDYQAFIGPALSSAECGYPQGGFLQYQTYYLAIAQLLNTIRAWLENRSSLRIAQIDYADIQIGDTIRWHDIRVDKLIFCEGARVLRNPWFNTLPMQPAQGEILTLQTRDPLPKWIINAGRWLLPLEQGRFKLGSTYVWPTEEKPLNEKTSEQAKDLLLKNLTQLYPGLHAHELISHEVGIRPSSKDRRPLIGFHQPLENLAVFNGFGSKGSMLIPYYTQHFVKVLLNGATLDPDVDIKRTLS